MDYRTDEFAPVRSIMDRHAIYDVLCRYCRGIDRHDLDLVRECYFQDAIDHHIGFEGVRDDFLEWVEKLLSEFDGTMHTIGNHLIELQGDVANVETYVHTWMWKSLGPEQASMSVTGTRYVDRFENRAGHWRIAERWAVRSFVQSASEGISISGFDGPVPLRSNQDLAYTAGR